MWVNEINADSSAPKEIKGYQLVWNDEFDNDGTPDNSTFPLNYEIDWVRVYQKK